MAQFDAVCVGESMVLLSPEPPERLDTCSRLQVHVAGAESNVAAYLAMLGHRSAWVSRVGADPFGRVLLDRIGAYGVHTDLVEVRPDAPTGVFFKDPDPAGTSVYYYRKGSAASTMDKVVWGSVPQAHVVHMSGVTAALSRSCAELVEAGLATRPVGDALMSFDVNYRSALWPATEAGTVLARLAALADVVFVGQDEAHVLWGCATPEDVRAVLPNPATLVVKDGGFGATAYGPTGKVFVPARPVSVVEPVGAGDAFAAGYLSGLLNGASETARLELGHEIAAAALRSVGDIAPIDALHRRPT